MSRKSAWSDDETVLAEGRKYLSRKEFANGSNTAYHAARKSNLLDQLYPSKRNLWLDDETVLAEGRKYSTRGEFKRNETQAYSLACKRNLLDQLYPSKRNLWLDDETLLAEGRKYLSRKEFQKGSSGAYQAACKRNLLDQLYPSTLSDWSDDETVLDEGRKYSSRSEFKKGSKSAYRAACKRNLLDLINFPENNAKSDNDAVYIWRAVGQVYNGNPVYKIGVTSARLGTIRVEQVAKASGFEFDLICCEPVQCKATDLEKKLHLLGENPQFIEFDGCTEFRALSDSALYAAISLICSSI